VRLRSCRTTSEERKPPRTRRKRLLPPSASLCDLCGEFFSWIDRSHAEIDWSREPEWLDKEFESLVWGDDDRKGIIDKLGKVFLRDGKEEWILIHVDVQGGGETVPGFNRRMRRYNFLIEAKYGKEALSLAVLTDDSKGFRPGRSFRRRAGQVHYFKFPVVKLLDYESRREELEASTNPFSIVVLAHLEAAKTATDEDRFAARFQLARRFYRGGFGRENLFRIYRFCELIMKMPKDFELALNERIEAVLEGKRPRPFMSTIELVAMEKGLEQGREPGREQGREQGREESREALRACIRLVLKLRFGEAGLALLPAVAEIKDLDRLRSLLDEMERVEGIEQFRTFLGR
jgi:hypothetical protein